MSEDLRYNMVTIVDNTVLLKFAYNFPCGSDGKESACNAGDLGLISGWEDPLEEGMAIHSSILCLVKSLSHIQLFATPWTM